MFKKDYESVSDYKLNLSFAEVSEMMQQAFPGITLTSFEVLKGGCGNYNLRVVSGTESYILRLYLRDPAAACREKALSKLLHSSIPVPIFYYAGNYEEYTFAVIEFMPGISLREVLLTNVCAPDFAIMTEVGEMLSHLQNFTFPKSGFFDANLHIMHELPTVKDFALKTLENETVQTFLGSNVCINLRKSFQQADFSDLENTGPVLVHADFDPANILMTQKDGVWKVSALLDFEFAFAGSYLHDLASMLRYAHKMPEAFKEAFLRGYGKFLPDNNDNLFAYLNIAAILDILSRGNLEKRPKMAADIRELLDYFLKNISL